MATSTRIDALDEHDVEAFRRDGAVCLRGALSAAELELLKAGIDDNLAHPSPRAKVASSATDPGFFIEDFCSWTENERYRRFIFESRLGAIAGRLTGSSSIRLYHDHMLTKEPGTRQRTPWHQDQPYYNVDGNQTVSLWVPLDPVVAEVCPKFLAGSQADGKLYVPKRFKTNAALEGDTSHYTPFDGVDEVAEKARLRFWALQPGDAIAFNFKTLHNAPPNTSANRRRAISFRFFGDDARHAVRPHAVSPPYPEMGLTAAHAAVLPEEWFPVVWHA